MKISETAKESLESQIAPINVFAIPIQWVWLERSQFRRVLFKNMHWVIMQWLETVFENNYFKQSKGSQKIFAVQEILQFWKLSFGPWAGAGPIPTPIGRQHWSRTGEQLKNI